MIDFRYHIVSIVSIFLALAVGIVLGAGPLQNEIGSTLQSEIKGLRDDKTSLNEQLGQARSEVEQQDTFLGAVSDRIVAGALDGRSVAVVVLPGADAAVADAVVEDVAVAGGRVGSRTALTGDWVSTDGTVSDEREAAVALAATEAGVDVTGGNRTAGDVLLSTLLTRSAPAGDAGPDDTTARTALQRLADAGLLSLEDPDTFGRAELAVVVSGAVADGDDAARTAAAQAWVALADALDARSRGTVLAADVESEGDGVSVLTTLRDSDARSGVSSVDDAAGPTGLASVVFALAQQDGGDSGQYGTAPGADAAFAPVPGS